MAIRIGGAARDNVRWLGQAGFLLTGSGPKVAIDPYLSHRCEEIYGLRRTVEPPVGPEELGADVLLISHWHEDHFDLPTVRAGLARGARVVAPASVLARLAGAGHTDQRVEARLSQPIDLGRIRVTPVPARHRVPGFLTEDAVGFLVELDGSTYYHSGDTEYTRGIVTALKGRRIDAALVCINGTGGNMNVSEAALLCAQLDAGSVVPMHFGMWEPEAYGPGATLDPGEFEQPYRALGGQARVTIPRLETDHGMQQA